MMKSRFFWVLLVLALVAAACGGDDDDDGSTGGGAIAPSTEEPTEAPEEPTEAPVEATDDGGSDDGAADDAGTTDDGGDDGDEPVELTATARGVTADTITIGISMLDFATLVELGLSQNGWGDQRLVWDTFLADLNARGGINGRQVVAEFEFYNPIDGAQAEAACLRLAGDVESFAVLGGFLGPVEPANTCIVGQQNTILIEGRQNSERLAEAQAPWFVAGANRERRLDIMMSLLEQDGRVEGRKIAVVGSTATEIEYQQALDLLEAAGNPAVISVINDQAEGDIPAIDAFWQPLAERISVEGVDTVFLVGATTSGIRGVDLNALDVEVWAIDNDALASLGNSVSPEQADGVITVTGLSSIESWDHPTMARCREVFDAANPGVATGPLDTADGGEEWFSSITPYCRWLTLFELIATEAGPNLTPETFAAAAATLDQFELPGQPFNSLSDKFDANDSWRLGVFDASASADGEIVSLGGDLIDVTP